MSYAKNEILAEIARLHKEIDDCVTELIVSRLAHDTQRESKALCRMEGIMSGVLQDLSVFNDFILDCLVWKKAQKWFKCGEDDCVFTLNDEGKMSPYWDTEVDEGQYYITEQDLENLPVEQ